MSITTLRYDRYDKSHQHKQILGMYSSYGGILVIAKDDKHDGYFTLVGLAKENALIVTPKELKLIIDNPPKQATHIKRDCYINGCLASLAYEDGTIEISNHPQSFYKDGIDTIRLSKEEWEKILESCSGLCAKV